MEPFAFHAPTPDLFEVVEGQPVVKLRLPASLETSRVLLVTEPDNELYLLPMTVAAKDERWRTLEAPLTLNPSSPVTNYAFKVIVKDSLFWLSNAGLTPYFPERHQYFHHVAGYRPASWVWSQIFYQIFPDRFFDGDPANNVQTNDYLYEGSEPVIAKAWGELPERTQGPREFYGGDLPGIEEKLPYLEDLGVTALYLNPVFSSPSNHKYDTVDYDTVDEHLGGDEALASLCKALHTRDMRIVLDAVINHTSERHRWFDRYEEYEVAGAYAGPASPTYSYYTFSDPDEPESYVGWHGVATLPVLDYGSPALRKAVYEDEDAILRRWMRPPYSIDGWRFDVIHMLGEGGSAYNNAAYVRDFKRALREENSEAYMLGEHSAEAARWLQGDQEDGAMNYFGFGVPLRAFLAGKDTFSHPVQIGADVLDYLLMRARAPLSFEIQLSQYNLLDSHDTERFITLLGENRDLIKVAATALMTYIGVPAIYYGDEIGLEGGRDPDCRRTFPWDESEWDHELRSHYQALIELRKEDRALQTGAYLTLYAQGDVFVYARILAEHVVLTALNRGPATRIKLSLWKTGLFEGTLRSLFDEQQFKVAEGELELSLEACSSVVLIRT